jgi:hypothetical protein
MSLNARIKKLERRQDLEGSTAIIYVEDGETNDESYRRTYTEGSKKPKTVVYLDSIDKSS